MFMVKTVRLSLFGSDEALVLLLDGVDIVGVVVAVVVEVEVESEGCAAPEELVGAEEEEEEAAAAAAAATAIAANEDEALRPASVRPLRPASSS